MSEDQMRDWLANVEKKLDHVIENHGQRLARIEAVLALIVSLGVAGGVAWKVLFGG